MSGGRAPVRRKGDGDDTRANVGRSKPSLQLGNRSCLCGEELSGKKERHSKAESVKRRNHTITGYC